MNCPYCNKRVPGMTGLQELQNFQKHLGQCKKNFRNLPLSDGRKTVITPHRHTLREAMAIRHQSGQ